MSCTAHYEKHERTSAYDVMWHEFHMNLNIIHCTLRTSPHPAYLNMVRNIHLRNASRFNLALNTAFQLASEDFSLSLDTWINPNNNNDNGQGRGPGFNCDDDVDDGDNHDLDVRDDLHVSSIKESRITVYGWLFLLVLIMELETLTITNQRWRFLKRIHSQFASLNLR